MTPEGENEAMRTQTGESYLRGVLERIIYASEENHYCVGEFRVESRKGRGGGGDMVTITGNLPGVQCGETLELVGIWTRHRVHGEQFKIRRYRSSLPASVYGIRKYLGSGLVRGIGKTYAEKIVDAFGADTLRMISEDSGRLREIPGIGDKRARAIKAAWDEQHALREVMMFLQTYGVGIAQCLKLVRNYGAAAGDVLRSDPYLIAREIHGIGFKTADRIALNLGFASDSPARLDAGVLFTMSELEGEGHTAIPKTVLIERATTLLDSEIETIAQRIEKLLGDEALRTPAGTDRVQLPGTEWAETAIAQSIARIRTATSTVPPIRVDAAVTWAQERAGFSFAPEQAEALRTALRSRLSILTGGPGTGKTTILRALVQILSAKHTRVLLGAPTGRAAQRMAESTGKDAQTLHRLLRFDPAQGRFTADQKQPLRCDFMIVDEASMLDTRLAAALFNALPPSANLLLVGDIHQLPSVGPGSVLEDLMRSETFTVTRLYEVFRQRRASRTLTAAYGILEGRTAPPGAVKDLAELNPGEDFHMILRSTPESCVETILELCRDWIPRHCGVDPVRETQVIAPMHKGVAGIANLNQQLQGIFNARGQPLGTDGWPFRVGDKVIQMANDYERGIYNGDFGFVEEVDPENFTLTASFDGRAVAFERADLGGLQLAYAISVHKSQGSEFPVVVIPLLKQHFLLLQRNLLYTAITRGRRHVLLVGDPTAYAMAVNNRESLTRETDLERKVREV